MIVQSAVTDGDKSSSSRETHDQSSTNASCRRPTRAELEKVADIQTSKMHVPSSIGLAITIPRRQARSKAHQMVSHRK